MGNSKRNRKDRQKGGFYSKIINGFLSVDVMGESIQFQIEGGTHKKSILGALVSLVVISITLI